MRLSYQVGPAQLHPLSSCLHGNSSLTERVRPLILLRGAEESWGSLVHSHHVIIITILVSLWWVWLRVIILGVV